MKVNKPIISFPHMGNYHLIIKCFMEKVSDGEVMTAPPITKRTIELGSKHSPDFVCVPFKYNLGNYIEALDNGANTLIQAGGGCRFGFYGEVQEQILRDLGYQFNFFNLLDTENVNPKHYYKEFKKLNPNLKFTTFLDTFRIAYEQVLALDKIEKFIRKNIGFELENGSFEKLEKEFQRKLLEVKSPNEVKTLYLEYKELFKNIPTNKPDNPLRVGIVGELYVLMEPFSNYFLEKELAKKGIEVTRFITVSYLLFDKEHGNKKKIIALGDPYIKFDLGADGTDSVARTHQLAKEKFDGIIHIKPFGCIPEVNSMVPLQRISRDFNIPIIYFSFDSQTSETGVKTRLEAFHDMLLMRKEKYRND